MRARSHAGRVLVDRLVCVFAALAAAGGIAVLFWILFEVLSRGASALNPAFFTQLPAPPGEPGGGVANAIVGTILITLLATALGVPIGLAAGVYLAEFGRDSRFATLTRFLSSVLMGMPSIIIGVFVYTLLVVRTHRFTGYAGAVALAVIMLPVIARTTEEMLHLVPNALREAALALGAPRWQATLGIVVRAARSGLLTGILLAVARVSGETAPLLFTSLNSPYWVESLDAPTANLTVTIFNYAMSPYENWQSAAWGASFLITAGILVVTVSARLALRERTVR